MFTVTESAPGFVADALGKIDEPRLPNACFRIVPAQSGKLTLTIGTPVSLPKTSFAAFLRGVASHASSPTLPRASGICRHHEAGVDSRSPARRTAAVGSD